MPTYELNILQICEIYYHKQNIVTDRERGFYGTSP